MRERLVKAPPTTPDGRYIVVRGRLWRRADPSLGPAERAAAVSALMTGRRAVRAALKAEREAQPGASTALAAAREAVQAAKEALGERGPVWWDDGTPDETRRLARNTRYAAWFAGLDGKG
ncbi:hypothetical protein [Methylobacterium symbioticum]|uniref:Uncharacterized protein n=1 Tax=Methylobacterium symbioticum TaxID=2584084 RepID=A0A509EFZ5_9HYPH|nr:hypothetical protein [Methylobacterium symbioticum]VUD72113.1 hypothetical protein MET9862_02707 [Methylobacterium symbioticum]